MTPYLVRIQSGVVTKSVLTTGTLSAAPDVGGIPDGPGAYDNGTHLTVLMNHEIPNTLGVTRAHGAKGAFVPKWIIDEDTLQVLHGEDLIKRIFHKNSPSAVGTDPGRPLALSLPAVLGRSARCVGVLRSGERPRHPRADLYERRGEGAEAAVSGACHRPTRATPTRHGWASSAGRTRSPPHAGTATAVAGPTTRP